MWSNHAVFLAKAEDPDHVIRGKQLFDPVLNAALHLFGPSS